MKLYLSTTSPYSRLALIAALHSGKRDLQLHYVLPWENPADLLAINPYSQIPALSGSVFACMVYQFSYAET